MNAPARPAGTPCRQRCRSCCDRGQKCVPKWRDPGRQPAHTYNRAHTAHERGDSTHGDVWRAPTTNSLAHNNPNSGSYLHGILHHVDIAVGAGEGRGRCGLHSEIRTSIVLIYIWQHHGSNKRLASVLSQVTTHVHPTVHALTLLTITVGAECAIMVFDAAKEGCRHKN